LLKSSPLTPSPLTERGRRIFLAGFFVHKNHITSLLINNDNAWAKEKKKKGMPVCD